MSGNIDKVRDVMSSPETIQPAPGPGHNSAAEEGPPPPGAPVDPEVELLRACALHPLNDYGNGQRFIEYFGRDSLFVPRVGWHCYDGQVWNVDPDEIEIRRRAQKIAGKVLLEIDHVALDDWEIDILNQEPVVRADYDRLTAIEIKKRTDKERDDLRQVNEQLNYIDNLKKKKVALRKAHRAHARAAGNSGPIKNMLVEATVSVAHLLEEMDADPLIVNTASGALKFSQQVDEHAASFAKPGDPPPMIADMEMLEHDRALYLTKIIPVAFDLKAEAPLFHAFLERILPDIEKRKFLQRWFGLNMTALTGEQKLVFLYGSGSNGKSVLMDLIARILGGYSATAKIESLTGTNKRGGGDATPDLIPLMGARMVRASEPEEGERLREGMIKELTGGEPMLVRALHSDFVEVKPKFKLTISGNHKPEIRGTDDGIWRRVLLVPFDVQIPREERDKDLGEKLWAERSGVLNWLCEGLRDYLANGLQEPAEIVAATQDFREQSNPVHAFLMKCCEVGDGDTITTRASDLVDAFNHWRTENGEDTWRKTIIARKFADQAGRWKDPRTGMTFTKGKASVSVYRGLKLTDLFKQKMEQAEVERQFGGGSSRGRDID